MAATEEKLIRVAVTGVGSWGRNLARNYGQIRNAELSYICDINKANLDSIQPICRPKACTTDFQKVIDDPNVDAVVIATPAPSHHSLGMRAIQAGKDVYIEKPFAMSSAEGRELLTLAQEKDRVLMVGHLLEYHPVVEYLKEFISSGELGEIRYIYTQRLNLGTVRAEENSLWNFAPHDISVILYLLGQQPTDVSARGQAYVQPGIEDVMFMVMNFADQAMGHVHVSWLDPHKTRKITIVGSKRMAVFDDLESTEKLKIYDKGAELNLGYNNFAESVGLRFGDIHIPHIRVGEPLRTECEHFLSCIRTRATPRSDGYDGLRVLEVLEAADKSVALGGDRVFIGE